MRIATWLIAFFLLLGGCSPQDLIDKMSSPEHVAAARAYVDQLRSRDFGAISRDLDPSIRGAGAAATLQRMAGLFPPGEPRSVKLVGVQSHLNSDNAVRNMTFEYEIGDRWLLANVALKDEGATRTIVGFNVYPRAQSLEVEHRFTLAGKGPMHYAVLAAAIAVVLLTIYALVLCLRTAMARRKWLWLLFIAIGIGQVNLDWTTGEWTVQPAAILLLGAGAFAAPYGPWTISVALPLGALVFLLWRRRAPAQSAKS